MRINDIFSQRKKNWAKLIKERKPEQAEVEYECPQCKKMLKVEQLKKSYGVCEMCGYYYPMRAKDRIRLVCDEKSFHEMDDKLKSTDPLSFPGYKQKLESIRKKTGMQDAVLTGTATMDGNRVAIAVLDSNFLMGSMGTVVGEKIVRLAEYARKKKLPLIIFAASGGARMQEGLCSLMQMARTSAAIEKFKEQGGLFISVLTNPTSGGVSASFASLGDIIIAEPKALICFAGPRVIEQTIGQKLPEGFQRAEFLQEHGMVDMIVERRNLRHILSELVEFHIPGERKS